MEGGHARSGPETETAPVNSGTKWPVKVCGSKKIWPNNGRIVDTLKACGIVAS